MGFKSFVIAARYRSPCDDPVDNHMSVDIKLFDDLAMAGRYDEAISVLTTAIRR